MVFVVNYLFVAHKQITDFTCERRFIRPIPARGLLLLLFAVSVEHPQ
jgi:hypothetical protein